MKSPGTIDSPELEGGAPSSILRADEEPRRAVLAEDDPELRALLAGALRKVGFEVTALEDGLELVRTMLDLSARRLLPDLVVSDVQMPRLSGLAALGELRRAGIGSPVLLITAFGDDDTHAAAIKLGAAIIDKPFDIYKFRTIAAALVR